jgi:hypothetical protein
MKIRAFILLAGAILGANGSAAAISGCSVVPAAYKSLHYQAVFQPTCHNCYDIRIAEKVGVKTFQRVLDQVQNVEIDIFDNYRSGITGNAVPGEWFVRHGAGWPSALTGNYNNCTGNKNGVDGTNNFGACLTDIKQWTDANCKKDACYTAPITLFLDKKEAWSSVSEGRRPADLDRLVESILGDKLYKPASLLQGGTGKYPDPRAAAKAGAWPTLKDLAGKVIVVLTGNAKELNEYLNDRRGDAALFVAADTDKASDITGTPNGFTPTTAIYVVFYNIQATDSRDKLGLETRANNYVSRLYDSEGWEPCKVLANCINDIALYNWNAGVCNNLSNGSLNPKP